MTNGEMFKDWIKSRGLKVCFVAEQINVDKCTLSRIFKTNKCSRQTSLLIKQYTEGEIDFADRG